MLLLEEDLISRAQAGEREAFEQLVRSYQRKVYTLAYRFTGNPEDASDLAQEAFIKIYRALPGFRGESSFSTWVHHVVSNVCRDHLRKIQRQPLADSQQDKNFESRLFICEDEQVQPENQLVSLERKELLQKHIDSLPPDYRLILIMRDLQDLTYDEIATVLGVNMGTVKSRLNRARQKLKEALLKDPYFAYPQTAVASSERREKA